MAEPKGIYVVEDCAHSTGATYKAGRREAWVMGGTAASTIKNMTTLGEGGMFTTNNADWKRPSDCIVLSA